MILLNMVTNVTIDGMWKLSVNKSLSYNKQTQENKIKQTIYQNPIQ